MYAAIKFGSGRLGIVVQEAAPFFVVLPAA